MTAAHVVLGAAPNGVFVRGVDKQQHSAVTMSEFTGEPNGLDLALVELPMSVDEIPFVDVAIVERDLAIPMPLLNCWSVGYPEFQEVRTIDGLVRETAQADGFIPPGENLVSGLLSLRVEKAPEQLPPGHLTLAQSPWSGMSGAAVFAGADLIGVVAEHAPRRGASTVSVTPLDHLDRLGEKASYWWSKLGVGQRSLVKRVPQPTLNAPPIARPSVQLGPEVRDVYQIPLRGSSAPTSNASSVSLDEVGLQALQAEKQRSFDTTRDVADQRAFEVSQALYEAILALPVVNEMGMGAISLGRLHVLYSLAVGGWPTNATSASLLLVEAALVTIRERRERKPVAMTALARFVTAIAVERRAGVEGHSFVTWLERAALQLADARRQYEDYAAGRTNWLLVDLGPESMTKPVDRIWPPEFTATLYSDADPITISVRVGTDSVTQGQALESLRAVFRWASEMTGFDRELVVDLACPRHLLDVGIEHWLLLETDGEYEPLVGSCRPRLRWSQRMRVSALRRRAQQRVTRIDWGRPHIVVPPNAQKDDASMALWLTEVQSAPWLLGDNQGTGDLDVLRAILRAGVPYVVWFRAAASLDLQEKLATAAAAIPTVARADVLPENIFEHTRPDCPTIIWDDPRGRDGHSLAQVQLQGPGG